MALPAALIVVYVEHLVPVVLMDMIELIHEVDAL